MNQLMQALENRRMMSVTTAQLTTDLQTVLTASTATRAALSALHSGDASFRSNLAQSVKMADTKTTRAANNKLLASLSHADGSNYSKITAADNALLAAAKADSTTAIADAKRLLAHPAKAAYQNKVNKDIALLAAISAKLTALENAILNTATQISPIYSQIVTDIPSVASLVQAAETSGGANTTAFSNAASQVLTDTGSLATDLSNLLTVTR
jgi:hypothetical protein